MKKSKEEIQALIIAFIKERIDTVGYPPSVREICKAIGFKSTSSVHAHLKALEKEGLLRRDTAKPRAIELRDTPKGRAVPLVGKVTAGQPILAQQNVEEEIILPISIADSGDLFALRIEGESMIEAGILSGDIVIVREQASAENGDIVVAMIDDEATVKRIYYESECVRLQPENSAFQPIYTREVTVLGRIVALLREY